MVKDLSKKVLNVCLRCADIEFSKGKWLSRYQAPQKYDSLVKSYSAEMFEKRCTPCTQQETDGFFEYGRMDGN